MMICYLAVVAIAHGDGEYRALLHGGHVIPITEEQYTALFDYLDSKNAREIQHVMSEFEGLDQIVAAARGHGA